MTRKVTCRFEGANPRSRQCSKLTWQGFGFCFWFLNLASTMHAEVPVLWASRRCQTGSWFASYLILSWKSKWKEKEGRGEFSLQRRHTNAKTVPALPAELESLSLANKGTTELNSYFREPATFGKEKNRLSTLQRKLLGYPADTFHFPTFWSFLIRLGKATSKGVKTD